MSDLSGVAWNEFSLAATAGDRVSPHFTFHELTKSELASRLEIPNGFTSAGEARAAVHLCREVMEPVRAQFGAYSPNSVYRSQALERALKKKPANWVSDSQHTRGEACDIEAQSATNMDLALWISKNVLFDQLILECYNDKEGPRSGWVHVSLLPPGSGRNRRQVLSYVMGPAGKFVYVEGLRKTA